ncbi:uncharacterized protein LOC128475093 [Spea bombifrons]|uniref:uncharacterized protein LOC128475093 n=1 Tax=Spea bombifrons TaxID=233779 RepID=UPI00234B06C0|nr:uncharacterized protein LOC128475093 [Spea bombifrons]XP_053313546.1 uncharacterized protein LOC128475093 [Spea bombifrons]
MVSRKLLYILFVMATLWVGKLETTVVNNETNVQDQFLGVKTTESLTSTGLSNVEGTTVAPLVSTRHVTSNSSDSQQNNTSLSSPALSVVTTGMSSTKRQGSINGTFGPTFSTNAANPTSISSSTTLLTGSPTTISTESETTTLTTPSEEYSSTESKYTTSNLTEENSTSQNNTAVTSFNGTLASNTSGARLTLTHSEAILTSVFSIILAFVALAVLIYIVRKHSRRISQYSHHPLHETSNEPEERYLPPEDTLVISGGLYDAPRIYNPNMSVLEEEEVQHDYVSFGRPGQFRLEFLPGDKEIDSTHDGSLHGPSHSRARNV